MVAPGNRVLLVQNGVHGPGNGLAVVNVHAALFVNVQPQEILGALPHILHVPQLAAMLLHDGFRESGYLLGDLHETILSFGQ